MTSVRDGGLERVVLEICRGLPKDGYDFEVCALLRDNPWEGAFRNEGIAFHSWSARNKTGLSAVLPNAKVVLDLAAHLRSFAPDLVIVHDFFPGVLGRVAAILAGTPRVIVVLHATYDWLGPKAGIANRLLGHATDRIVAVSQAAMDASRKRDRISERKYEVIPNGIDLSRFEPSLPVRQQTRAALGLSVDDIAIGCVGVIRESKRQTDLVSALRSILHAEPRLKLLLVGSERQHEQLYASQLQEQISLLPADRILRIQNRQDMEAVYSVFDIFVTPSASEGFGLALAEAMASGVPCIASDIAPHVDISGSPPSLVTYPLGDVDRLAQAILELVGDIRLRRDLSIRGRERIATRYSIQSMLGRWDRLLRDIAELDQ